MDTINERKEQPKPEAVRLEQRFQLIKPEHLTPTVWRDSPNQGRGFSCPINLESFPGNSSISFDIHLSDTSSISPDWITPFNPDTGYNITNEDLNPKNRYAKLRRLDIHTPKIKNGFDLSFSSKGELPKNEDVLKELQRLRIHLFFPDWGGFTNHNQLEKYQKEKLWNFLIFILWIQDICLNYLTKNSFGVKYVLLKAM